MYFRPEMTETNEANPFLLRKTPNAKKIIQLNGLRRIVKELCGIVFVATTAKETTDSKLASSRIYLFRYS